jgi:hypothetical protein
MRNPLLKREKQSNKRHPDAPAVKRKTLMIFQTLAEGSVSFLLMPTSKIY